MGKRKYVESTLIRTWERGLSLGATQALFYLEYDRDEARDHLEYVDCCIGLSKKAMEWALERVYGPTEEAAA